MTASRNDIARSDRSTLSNMCGRSSEYSLQDLFVFFPKHGLRVPAAVRENDRTRAATEIKPNHDENIHFVLCKIYFCVRDSGAKCKQTKIEHTGRSGKKQIYY